MYKKKYEKSVRNIVDVDKKYHLNLPNRFLKDFSVNDCKLINEDQEKITMIYKGTKTFNSGKTLHLIEFEKL